jgi:hypothetical protein
MVGELTIKPICADRLTKAFCRVTYQSSDAISSKSIDLELPGCAGPWPVAGFRSYAKVL